MSRFILTRRIFSFTTSSYGYHHHHTAALRTAFSEGRLRRERGVPFLQQKQQQQECLLQGSYGALSRFHHYHLDYCLHCCGGKASSHLPSPLALPILQEKLLDSKLRDCNTKILEHGSDIVDRSMPFSANIGVSLDGLVSNTNWVMSKFGFCKKIRSLGFGGQFRAFSSCEEERESDGDGKGDNDDGDGGESGGAFVSSADPVEVSRVTKVIDELFALDRNMEAVLDESGINLSCDLVVEVLQRFKHARKPAFRFFCWAGQQPGFLHDSRTYNAMLFIMGKTRQFETLGSLLEEMGEKGLLNLESFTTAIKAYAAGKERKKAIGVFELMKKHGFKAGVETINCMLDALAREKLVKEAQELFVRLKSRFTPNTQTYTVLLSGWCKMKNLMEACKIWNEMIDQGLKPDIITHNIMLDGLLKVKKRSDAIKLFEVMKAKGPVPNVRSYTILIRDFCKHSKMKEAVAYFDEMMASGCEPDVGVYTCLITGYGNIKKMDMVHGLLKEMKEKGYSPDGQLYNALIKLMINRRMPDDSLRIYKKMIQSGNQPTIHTYNMMMKSYFMAGNSEMACAVWDEMILRGCCPDENSFAVLIVGLIRQGRSEEACKHVEEMINKGMRVPELDFDKFVADFSRVGRPNILEELARKMRLSGKSEVSEIFARWAQKTKKRVTGRGI